MSIDAVYQNIQEDLDKVETEIQAVVEVDFPFQAELLRYCLQEGGKRIRPILTLLAGKLFDYDPAAILPMAAAIELMHTATLVHDDAIDHSSVRRGRTTVNILWGEEIAILLGDYLFARAGEFATDTGNLHVVRLFTQTLRTISGGEINQAHNAFNLNQTRQQYIDRIAGKTASLFILSTESGAILGRAGQEDVEALREYGYHLGIAFQIVDDILDFTSTEEEMGKPIGADLAQGTLTLPAMLILERHPEDNPVKRIFESGGGQDDIQQAIELVRSSTIVQECYAIASEYASQACRHLEGLSDRVGRQRLVEIADYVVARKK
ncbi:MAG: polyprenyl synthetase family protein [Chloroflexi bacterium]|nr:polyprenyl synthetase family protein [Chloroflexota bacterium]